MFNLVMDRTQKYPGTGENTTRHNSADSVSTSNLVCKEVAIRTTFSHMINIAGLIYYTCNLVIDIQCTCYENAFNKRF